MAQSLNAAIGKLKALRAELVAPTAFFQQQLATPQVAVGAFHAAARADTFKWIGIAQATARDVIFYSLPANTDPTEWGFLADYIASQVGILLAPGGNGVVIYLGPNQAEFSFASVFGSVAAAAETVTLDQITEYVEAGLRGDPLGKPDINEHDQLKTARQTAFNILRAFYKRSFRGEREEAVLKFIENRSMETAEQYLPAIVEAWKNVFEVIAVDDFKVWVERRARAILT